MDKINYPLLCYPIDEDLILGMLVGTDHQVMGKNLKSVSSSVSNYLNKLYKKYDEYEFMDIISPKLKIFEIKVRPTYREENGHFPDSREVKVPIPAIYGENEEGVYECYLPLFNESFYYHDVKQFRSLVHHFASNHLNYTKPERIHQLIMYPEPFMEIVSLKVNYAREFNWSNTTKHSNLPTLSRLAEQFPYSKSIRRNLHALPDTAWEMETHIDQLIDKLINQRANVILVGNHGVGKSAVLNQAIKKIAGDSKKKNLNYTFWKIIPQRITASAKYLGEWQESCERLIEELAEVNGVLWVEEIIRLLQTGGSSADDSIASFFISFIQEGKLQLVGEITPRQLESMRRLLPGFVDLFQFLEMEELTENKVFSIMDKFALFTKQTQKLDINKDALALTYRLLLRYFPYEKFPGKAIKFLSQSVGELKLTKQKVLTKEHVITNLIKQTGLPELFVRDEILLDTDELLTYFKSKIIGQPQAINRLLTIVKIYKAGLNNPGKPINTLLFAGPTGVGKTASAKALADYFFGKGQKKTPLVRIDMSEFQDPSQIYRFIGIGNEPGKLVKEIRERPFSVLLLDEVEKAHPAIFDALMTVLDEGMMVDNFGRVTNFRNSIIIMTTNLGASNQQSIGFKNTNDEDTQYLSAIGRFFRPEFVNRIDNVVMFHPLDKNEIHKITIKELSALEQREGFEKRALKLIFSENIVQHLTDIGFDYRYGARPLQRVIEQTVVSPLASWLLNHPKVNSKTLNIDFEGVLKITVV